MGLKQTTASHSPSATGDGEKGAVMPKLVDAAVAAAAGMGTLVAGFATFATIKVMVVERQLNSLAEEVVVPAVSPVSVIKEEVITKEVTHEQA